MMKDKWLNGSCKHICLFCKYRNLCLFDYGIIDDED